MSRPRELRLSPAQRDELEAVIQHDPLPYMRERASAVVKVADGMSISQVAREGLLQPRSIPAVRSWVDRYEAEGLDGLRIRPGRGRKPAFFPSAPRCGKS